MNADSKEAAFQQDIIDQMVAGGWKLGDQFLGDTPLEHPLDPTNLGIHVRA